MAENKRIAGDQDARGVDMPLLFLAGLILTIGLIMVASASITLADKTTGSPFYFLTRQLVFLVVGTGCGALMYNLPLAWWQRSGYLLLMLAFAVFLTSSDEALLNNGEKLLCSSVPMKVSHSCSR